MMKHPDKRKHLQTRPLPMGKKSRVFLAVYSTAVLCVCCMPVTASAAGDPLTVINNPGFDLPKTGGYGTWMFTVGGCMLLGVAVFIVVRGRKHNRNDQ